MGSQPLAKPPTTSQSLHQVLLDTPDDEAPRLHIGYSPFQLEGNDYVVRMQALLGALGRVSPVPTLKQLARQPRRLVDQRFDLIVLNWNDSKLARHGNGRLAWSGLGKFLAEVAAYRVLARRLVFVRHNRFPHHANARSGRRIARLLDHLERLFDLTVIHSGDDLRRHRHYVPHPLYQLEATAASAPAEDYFVVFGRIMRYKNIRALVEAFPADRRLVIAGPCSDIAYLDEVRAAAAGKAVDILPRFLDDEEAKRLLLGCRASIVCHADGDMIVSGSYFFAASLGVPVLALRTPFFEWLARDGGALGLTLFDALTDLQTALARVAPVEQHRLLARAQALFGDAAVTDAWQAAFARIGALPAQRRAS